MAPRREQYKREITLLSRGYTNPTAWPGGKITVYPWDNEIDDWVVRNVKILSKEEFSYSLLEQCCNLNGGKVDDFIAEEINIILLVSRARLTSDRVKYTATCPMCGKNDNVELEIPNELGTVGVKAPDYKGFDDVTLPIVEDVVRMHPLTVRDERAIVSRPDDDRKAIPDNVFRVLSRILSVNDSQPDNVNELLVWYRALHPTDSKFLESKGREITPHLDSAIPHKCDECGKSFTHILDFGVEFFR